MLTQCTDRLNHINKKPDNRSPYFIQYKIFEDRLKNQGLKWKIQKSKIKRKHSAKDASKKQNTQDYLQVVKQMLKKNQNINIFQGLPEDNDQDDITTQISNQPPKLAIIKAKCRNNQSRARSQFPKNTSHQPKKDQDMYSNATQNLMVEFPSRIKQANSRIKSETNTVNMRIRKNIQRNPQRYVSFLGYKKDHKFMKIGCTKLREII